MASRVLAVFCLLLATAVLPAALAATDRDADCAGEDAGRDKAEALRLKIIAVVCILFSLTTPVGIGVGISISSVYDETSPTALVVQGLLEAAAAGILVYMALVDILAEDFAKLRVQSRARLQLGLNVSLLLGAGLMSLLAIWA